MSFLGPPFKHDVFVSYAHGTGERLKHWSKCLKRELEEDIRNFRVKFKNLDIFIDDELDPTKPLTDQLQDKVRASGILLVIMSDRYLDSAWCNDELEWFEGELKESQKDSGLVLLVRAHPTDHKDWPNYLKDERDHPLPGFKFHAEGHHRDDDELVYPYGWPEPLPTDREYYCELGRLSTSLTKRLNEIKSNLTLRTSVDQPYGQSSMGDKPSIYLQAPASELDVWRLTKQVMEASDFRVFPDVLPSINGNLKAIQEERKKRLQILNKDAHALCLLGSREGNDLERDIEAIANDRAALQAFDKDIPCALLHRGEGEVPLAKDLGIEVISQESDDWRSRFRVWLNGRLIPEVVR